MCLTFTSVLSTADLGKRSIAQYSLNACYLRVNFALQFVQKMINGGRFSAETVSQRVGVALSRLG
jgi:hypothetical protein